MTRWAALFFAGAIYGVLGEFIFRRFTDRRKLQATLDRMLAHALELPLFFDEPSVVWRAQRALFVQNLRLLRQVAGPCVLVAGLFLVLERPMDRYLGRRPLTRGETAVITEPLSETPRLPPGIVVETPPVRIPRSGIQSWRVQAVTTNADKFPYRGDRAPWLLWFALVSMAAAAGMSFSR